MRLRPRARRAHRVLPFAISPLRPARATLAIIDCQSHPIIIREFLSPFAMRTLEPPRRSDETFRHESRKLHILQNTIGKICKFADRHAKPGPLYRHGVLAETS